MSGPGGPSDQWPTRLFDPLAAPVAVEPENDLHLRALVSGANTDGEISLTWVQLAGKHRRLRTARSTRVYVVLSGGITVRIGDEPPVVASAGQLVLVPRDVPYDLEGTGTYLVINTPAFVAGDDVYF